MQYGIRVVDGVAIPFYFKDGVYYHSDRGAVGKPVASFEKLIPLYSKTEQ